MSVLGASAALGDHLTRHPADWRLLAGEPSFPVENGARELTADLLAAVGAEPGPEPVASRAPAGGRDAATRLRIGYRRGCCGWRRAT